MEEIVRTKVFGKVLKSKCILLHLRRAPGAKIWPNMHDIQPFTHFYSLIRSARRPALEMIISSALSRMLFIIYLAVQLKLLIKVLIQVQ